MFAKPSIQLQDRQMIRPMREIVFVDFSSLYEFAKTFDRASGDGINIHLPWYTSDDERHQIKRLGFVPN
jgi:hypothetical protein